MSELKKEKYVMDLTITISGALRSMRILEKIRTGIFYVPWDVIVKLREMANSGLEDGLVGIEELAKMREKGAEIRFVRRGEKSISLDEAVMEIAKELDAVILTSDQLLHKLARSAGLRSELVFPFREEGEMRSRIREFFDEDTLSVHLKEGVKPTAKKGVPGNWRFETIRDTPMTREELEAIIREIIEEVRRSDVQGFIEIERPSSTIIQLEDLRIVITKPPFSDAIEITAVRPVRKLSLEEYNLPKKLIERLKFRAEGILIAGPPGHGKTTFAQALAEFYKELGKIVKTIEAPRDMILSKEITRYSKAFGTPDEIHDILLLSRPDYTIFDEMRNSDDFQLFADLRLAGVGMIGVIHATTAVDAIQRFIGKVELGMIPSIIDTVIFMNKGEVNRVLALKTTVKVPHGLQSEDLARPVVVIFDFITNRPMFEIYTFGERTFVVPVSREATKELYGSEEDLGGGEKRGSILPYVIHVRKKSYVFDFGRGKAGRTVTAYLGSRFLFADMISRSGTIKIEKRSRLGKVLKDVINQGQRIIFYEENGVEKK